MNKTTVRFVGVGAVLLLSVLAIALAQHDSRQSPDSELILAKPQADEPQIIPVDDSPLWGHSFASAKTIVRANDDRSSAPPSLDFPEGSSDAVPPSPLPLSESIDNPLRRASGSVSDSTVPSLDQFSEPSSVQYASGEAPPKNGSPELPSTMPSLQAQPIPSLVPQDAAAGNDIIRAPKPGWTQSPPLTAPPITAPANPGNAPNLALPPTLPGAAGFPSTSRTPSMSEPQLPAMPPTTLAPRSPGLQPPPGGNGFPNAGNVAPPSATNPSAPRAPGQLITAPLSNTPTLPGTSNSLNPNLNPTEPSATLRAPLPATTSSPGAANFGNSAAPNDGGVSSGNTFDSNAKSPYAGTILGRLISNQPGNSSLYGSQNPAMLIQVRMAGECQVGKKTTVVITVRNAGNATAQAVEVIDSVPAGATFVDSMPSITPTPEGILVWKLGEMGPNDERTITSQIIPQRQGEIGSTAVVRIATQASARTLATLPKLELTFQSVPDVLIGNSHAIDVNIRNTGTGVAKAVKLEAFIPKGLRHASGTSELESDLGDIAPGGSINRRLENIAAEAGAASVVLRALTEDGVQQEQKAELRVLAPALEAVVTGPNRRYLDRQAIFKVMIKNSGSAPATNCEFTMRLPSGLNFNTAGSRGEYKAEEHAIMWSVPEWPAGYAEEIEFTVLPVEIGQQQMNFQAVADLGVKTEARGSVTVEEQGELTFTIDQDADPIELSSSTTYTVEVRNVGRSDRNVELTLQLPPGSEVLKVDAPVQARAEGNQLRFDPIPQMDGRTSQKFRIEVRHGNVGTQKVSAQLRSQNRPTLVIKEEATEVYNDRD